MKSHIVRCRAYSQSSNKKRLCRNSAFPYKFCNVHLAKFYGVVIRLSSIEGAGYGVFAARDLEPGTRFPYLGDVSTLKEFHKERKKTPQARADYAYEADYTKGNRVIIDALDRHSCVARYINDSIGTGNENNCFFYSDPKIKKSYIKTSRKIKKGEELFVDYGPEYWTPAEMSFFQTACSTDSATELITGTLTE